MARLAHLADLTSPAAAERAAAGAVLAVPIGSTEQHGPHLPLSTDTDVAIALCERLAGCRPNVVIAPPLAYGSSGEHAGFAGTLSIGQDALELVVVELVRSATDTFPRVVLVSAHGGNAEPLARAVAVLRGESRDVLLHQPRWAGDPHAGHTETSMLLALHPQLVALDRAVVGATAPITELLPALRRDGVRAVSPSGVLGDPTGASAIAGAAILDALVVRLVADVDAWLAGRR